MSDVVRSHLGATTTPAQTKGEKAHLNPVKVPGSDVGCKFPYLSNPEDLILGASCLCYVGYCVAFFIPVIVELICCTLKLILRA